MSFVIFTMNLGEESLCIQSLDKTGISAISLAITRPSQ